MEKSDRNFITRSRQSRTERGVPRYINQKRALLTQLQNGVSKPVTIDQRWLWRRWRPLRFSVVFFFQGGLLYTFIMANANTTRSNRRSGPLLDSLVNAAPRSMWTDATRIATLVTREGRLEEESGIVRNKRSLFSMLLVFTNAFYSSFLCFHFSGFLFRFLPLQQGVT